MLRPPESSTSRLVTTASLLRTSFSLSKLMDTPPASSQLVFSSMPTKPDTLKNKHWKHYQENRARLILTLSHSRQGSSPSTLPGYILTGYILETVARSRLINYYTTTWLSGRLSTRTIDQNKTAMVKSTSADLHAHEK